MDILSYKKNIKHTRHPWILLEICYVFHYQRVPIALRMGLWPGARKDGDKVPGGLATAKKRDGRALLRYGCGEILWFMVDIPFGYLA